MSDQRDISERTYSRRTTLKAGAVTAGAVALGGMTGVAGAKGPKGGGGRAFVTSTAYSALDGKTFYLMGEVDSDTWNPTSISPSCNGNASGQDHVPYETNLGPWVFVLANRNVNTGEKVMYTLHNSEEDCGDVGDGRSWVKTRLKPA